MRTKNLPIALALLLAVSVQAGAQEFGLVLLTVSDLRTASAQAVPAPAAPQAELSGLEALETAAYLADSEAAPETYEKAQAGEPAPANLGGDGIIKLYHQWTKESIEIRYRDEAGRYLPEALARLKHFFRCRLTGREMPVPSRLLEIIDAVQERQGGRTVTVICGYRSPELNGALAGNSDGVAKKSLHLKGWAADIKIDGVRTSVLRDTAKALKAGGVGYYPSDGFVHVDAGRVRYW
jgi:uncharacterized protein YcbK (DUF882 family)